MSSHERFRASARRIAEHHGGQAVTVQRGSVALLESISGDPPTLVCGVAAEDATSLPMTSTANLSGRLDPGVVIAVSGHALTYTVQSSAEPVAGAITATIDPELEAAVSGEAVALSPRALAFYGGPVELHADKLPAGWTLGAGSEAWALVPPNTDAGAEPRDGDLMTSPFTARVGNVAGRERVEYLVIMTPTASEEAA